MKVAHQGKPLQKLKTIQQVMTEEIYEKADKFAKEGNQILSNSRGSYYITLRQLEAILKEFEV